MGKPYTAKQRGKDARLFKFLFWAALLVSEYTIARGDIGDTYFLWAAATVFAGCSEYSMAKYNKMTKAK
ncbi:MAG: hypothetical protein FWC61_01645 [Proteobacteria bacterium]|nr:hypothetical protein [Pseudomonadota bacterium]